MLIMYVDLRRLRSSVKQKRRTQYIKFYLLYIGIWYKWLARSSHIFVEGIVFRGIVW